MLLFVCICYNSDVIGFGRICGESTPFDIVELLNDLYSIMDDVIDGFDCYKVETIADSCKCHTLITINFGL